MQRQKTGKALRSGEWEEWKGQLRKAEHCLHHSFLLPPSPGLEELHGRYVSREDLNC